MAKLVTDGEPGLAVQLTLFRGQGLAIGSTRGRGLPASQFHVAVLGIGTAQPVHVGEPRAQGIALVDPSPDPTPQTWYQAVYQCTTKVVGGRMGWRLPTVEELASLIDPTQHNPSLPKGHPFIGVGNVYYTMTTVPEAEQGYNNFAWAVGFFDGYLGPSEPPGKTIAIPAWCVRGGHGYGGYPNAACP
jgi:hypothetical protein